MTLGGDQIDNRFYNPKNIKNDVDNDISNNNLWQYHKEPFIFRFINVESSMSLCSYRNDNSVDSADYAINFPFAIMDPTNGEQTCVLQFPGFNPYPLFHNDRVPPHQDFPDKNNAVYYFDSNLDNISNDSVIRTKSALSGLYIFINPSYCCVYSYLSANGGIAPGSMSKKPYPNLYNQNGAPFTTQNYTNFFLFEWQANTNKFLSAIISNYLKLNLFLMNSPGHHIYADASPTYLAEDNLFYSFEQLFSTRNLTKIAVQTNNNTLQHFQSIQITTSNSPELKPFSKTSNTSHNFQYEFIDSKNSSIKFRDVIERVSLVNIIVPRKLKFCNNFCFFSRIYLVNQNNYQKKAYSTDYWWQPYIVNTINKNGTGFLSDEFKLLLQPPERFNFRSGNPFNYRAPTYRSASIHIFLILFLCFDAILIFLLLVLWCTYIMLRKWTLNANAIITRKKNPNSQTINDRFLPDFNTKDKISKKYKKINNEWKTQ